MAQALDPRIVDELKAKYKTGREKGDLLSREQLARYYSAFRTRFGPDRLKALDGEEMLEVMHNHGNRDSLVYWLEFKDDDEFPSPKFGNISGGSAHKFGLFRKKGTGKWIGGSPLNEQELTLEQAIEKARQHREQLLRGVELLENLPADGIDEDYERLQHEMNRVAPDVSDMAWGRKYFYLLSPDKLDDFHNPDYQRTLLMKLLQLPPEEEGRYVAAGRFVSIARLLGIPMNNLTAILNELYGMTSNSSWSPGIQLQREIQEGLITLLVRAALPENRDQPYVVITTSPSQWLPYCSSDRITIVDVSGLFGSAEWRVESDAKDRLIEEIRASGWSEQQILSDAQVSAITSRFNGPEASKIRDRIDIALLGDNQQPIAVVALKIYGFSPEVLSKEIQLAANMLDIPFVITTDGRQMYSVDMLSGTTQKMAAFPSPRDFGLNSTVPSKQLQLTGNTGPTIVRCDTPISLIEALSRSGKVATIIDFTLPWGDWKTGKASRLRALLPETVQDIRQLDSYVTLLLLAAAQGHTNRLVCIVPQIFTYTQGFARVRAYLSSHMKLTGVVELPGDLFSEVRIHSSILVLNTFTTKSSQKTAFLSLPTRGDMVQVEGQSWFSSVIAGLQGKPMNLGFLTQVSANDTWTINQHHPESRAIEERIKRLTPTSTLGEMFDIIIGLGELNKRAAGGKDILVIRGKDIYSHLLTRESLDTIKIDTDAPERVKVRQGDILLQRIGTAQNVKAMVVNADIEGAVALDTVIILRPKEPSRLDSALIKQFLQSIAGRSLLSMRTYGAVTILIHALETVPIPVLPPDTSFDLDELQKLEDDLRLRADKMESMRLGLFNAESGADFRNQLRALRQTAQAVAASIQQAESIDFQIRNFYPYPLVFPYRTLASLIHPRDQYTEQLRIAENILAFLGSLTLALIPPEEFSLSGLDLKSYWQGGISPGHWLEICRKGADILHKDGDNHLAIALWTLQKDKKQKQFRNKLEELVKMKNDLKHDRGPKVEEEFQAAASIASDLLRDVLYKLSFLTEYPLRLVSDVDLIRGTRRVNLRTLRYTGDHPGLLVEQCEYSELLKKGDLYIQLEVSRWVSLFPFITIHNCPNCKTHETYFVDYWEDQKARLKSFERGHTQDSHEVAVELSSY